MQEWAEGKRRGETVVTRVVEKKLHLASRTQKAQERLADFKRTEAELMMYQFSMPVFCNDALVMRSKRVRRRRIAQIKLALLLDAFRVSSPGLLSHLQTSCKHSMFSGFNSEILLTPSSRMAIMISLSMTRAGGFSRYEG
jgi:hypothetical protein